MTLILLIFYFLLCILGTHMSIASGVLPTRELDIMELRIRNTILNQRNIYLQTSINQKNLDIRELQKSNKELTSTNIDLQRGKEQFEYACQELNGDLRTRIENHEIAIQTMQTRIDKMQIRINNLGTERDEKQTTIDTMQVRIDNLETERDEMQTRIDNLENEMQSKINILMDRVFNT